MSTPSNLEQQEYWNRTGGERWVAHQEVLDATVRPFGQAALARLGLALGEHTIVITRSGYEERRHEVAIQAGGELTLDQRKATSAASTRCATWRTTTTWRSCPGFPLAAR